MLSEHARLHTLAQQHPEWHPWLTLCAETLRELENQAWRTLDIRRTTEPRPHIPLLDGVAVAVDGSTVRGWIRRLDTMARTRNTYGDSRQSTGRLTQIDPYALLTAAARQDLSWLQVQADAVGAHERALQALCQLAVMPVLQECQRRFVGHNADSWAQGYCPLCGAWPVVAELRGVERVRHLRCSRCGAAWRTDWLRCPFCGETSHEHLAFLVLEGKEETHSVATCAQCRGYLKTLNTLRGAAPQEVMLDDVATVELDVVALDRGYSRPAGPGYTIRCQIAERKRPRDSFLRRFS